MTLILCIGLYVLSACVAGKKERSVNVALETVVKFGEAGARDDSQFIDHIQNFLRGLKTAIKRRGDAYQFRTTNEQLDFKHFIKSLSEILLTYDDDNLEKWFTIFDSEVRKYHYKGCKFHELVKNPEVRGYVVDKLDQIQHTSTQLKRVYLRHVALLLDNKLINYLNKLYSADAQFLTKFLAELEHYKMNPKETEGGLKMVVRNGVRSIIFDHYSNLNQETRQALIAHLESYFNTPESKKMKPTKLKSRRKMWNRQRDPEATGRHSDHVARPASHEDTTHRGQREEPTATESTRAPRTLIKKKKIKSKKLMEPTDGLTIESFEPKTPTIEIKLAAGMDSDSDEQDKPTMRLHISDTGRTDNDNNVDNTKITIESRSVENTEEDNNAPYPELTVNKKLSRKTASVKKNKLSAHGVARKVMKTSHLLKKVKRLETELDQFKERLDEYKYKLKTYPEASRKFHDENRLSRSNMGPNEAANATEANFKTEQSVSKADSTTSSAATTPTRIKPDATRRITSFTRQTTKSISTNASPTSEKVDPTSPVSVTVNFKTDNSTALTRKNMQRMNEDEKFKVTPSPLQLKLNVTLEGGNSNDIVVEAKENATMTRDADQIDKLLDSKGLIIASRDKDLIITPSNGAQLKVTGQNHTQLVDKGAITKQNKEIYFNNVNTTLSVHIEGCNSDSSQRNNDAETISFYRFPTEATMKQKRVDAIGPNKAGCGK